MNLIFEWFGWATRQRLEEDWRKFHFFWVINPEPFCYMSIDPFHLISMFSLKASLRSTSIWNQVQFSPYYHSVLLGQQHIFTYCVYASFPFLQSSPILFIQTRIQDFCCRTYKNMSEVCLNLALRSQRVPCTRSSVYYVETFISSRAFNFTNIMSV